MKKIPAAISALVKTVHETYEDSTEVLNVSQRCLYKALKGEELSLKVRENLSEALAKLDGIEVPSSFTDTLTKEREEMGSAPAKPKKSSKSKSKSKTSKSKGKSKPKTSKKPKEEAPAPAPNDEEGPDEVPSAPAIFVGLVVPSERLATLLLLLKENDFEVPSIRLA